MSFKKINNRRKLKVIEDHPYPIQVGTYVFLVGDTVIKKYQCIEKTGKGFRFKDLATGKSFVYITPTPYFTSGRPLFKNGLPCYPDGHDGHEFRWIKSIISQRAGQSITELINLYKELGLKSEIELFYINLVVQTATDVLKECDFRRINETENYYKDALGRMFAVWRRSFADFGGIINALDGIGLLSQDFFELNVERASRRGVSNFRIHALKRDVKISIQKALSRPGKG